MAQNQTLQNFIPISQSLKQIKIDCHNLVRTVRRVTKWTLVLEHHGTSNPPAPKDIRNALNAGLNEAEMDQIIAHASRFAPQYTIRRIQQEEEPSPKQTFASSSKVSEIADLQCFLKAYFYKICDERVEDKARRQRIKEEKKTKTREFPDWQAPATSKKKASHMEPGEGGKVTKPGDSNQHPPATGSGHSSRTIPSSIMFLPRPLLRPRPSQPPPPTAGRRRNRSESPQPSAPPPHLGAPSSNQISNGNSSQPQSTISGHAARQMAIEIYQEVVDAAVSGVPLMLELLGSSEEEQVTPATSSSRGTAHPIVRGLEYLDAGMAAQLEHAIRLRRLIVDPTEPRLALYDEQVRAAVDRARERRLKVQEKEDR
ncbi:hypothetical protein FRC00_007512 [Tulasnella sp. 408]|nr:hypothetical protein FRC00_007512 [Tulasnella sp. 408]